MQLSQKDKSLLLLIATALVVLWVVFTIFSRLWVFSSFKNSDIAKLGAKENAHWFNVSRPLEIDDFKDRVILLDFWSYSCVSCIQSLPEIKKLEERFGSKLLVIGVHSARFVNDSNISTIKKAVIKHDIDFPVVNDSDLKLWNDFKVKAWPSFVLINPRGRVQETYSGLDQFEQIKSDVKKLLSKYNASISREPLPMLLERYNVIGNVLTFPTKIEYSAHFNYKSRRHPALFIANSAQNNIVVSSLTGDIIVKIGSGSRDAEDGDFENASFNDPHGLLFDDNKLYVADSGNGSVRVIDFKNEKVETLVAGLSYPTDLEFFPNKHTLSIADAGSNQILAYDLNKKELSTLAGSGKEGIEDGKYPQNSLAQTADLSAFGGKLYFIDSVTSSLRVLDQSGEVTTLAGKSFDLQHPLGLTVDDTGAYIVDSYNGKIRKFDFASKKLHNFSSSKTELDEPEGIVAVLDRFYLVDSNNNRILSINRGNLSAEILNVMPPLRLPKEGFLEYLPNLHTLDEVVVKRGSKITLKITPEESWKINAEGPSFINLLELTDERKANLIASFDWNSVKKKEMILPEMLSGKDYLIQGTIYYCEDKKDALCYIRSYEQKIVADSEGKEEIGIILGGTDAQK